MASTNYKNECKNYANSNRLGKVIIGEETLDETNNIVEISFEDSCVSNNIINGNVGVKSVYISTLNYNKDILGDIINAQIGVKFADNTKEYEDLGNFIITEENIKDSASNSSYRGEEKATKLDDIYVCGISEENLPTATIGDFYIDVCTQLGLTPTATTFTNSTLVIGGNPFANKETNRTVLSNVASAGLYFIDIDLKASTIALKWLDTEVSETFTKDDYSSLTKNQVYGPIDCLVIRDTYTEGENVTRGTGEKEFTIDNNYFLYTEDLRNQAIDAIWQKVEGLTYVDYSMETYTGRPYLKKGKKISIQGDDGSYFTSYVLTHNFKYNGAFHSVLKATALADEQISMKNTGTSISTMFRNVERVVDKVNGEIKDVIEKWEVFEGEAGPVEKFEESLSIQTSNAITEWFNVSLKGKIDDIETIANNADSSVQEISTYIRRGITPADDNFPNQPYIILGDATNQTTLRILPTRIQFLTNGQETAYISNNQLYINESTILTKEKIGHWVTQEDENGYLNTYWED